jgi:hypothetical protein
MSLGSESSLPTRTPFHDDRTLDNGGKGKQPLSLLERTSTDINDAETIAGRTTTQKTFCHQPLDLGKDSIRLLEVLTPGADGSIRCRIRHAEMGAQESEKTADFSYESAAHQATYLEYSCLSNVWGPPEEDMRWIEVNGLEFRVRKNLWDFMTVASSMKVKLENDENIGEDSVTTYKWLRSLWIDALCIKQDNVLERNHQVQKMGQIFSNAELVIAWLGNNSHLATGFRAARSLSNTKRKRQISRAYRLDGLATLWDAEYWSRAWITQEVVLSRNLHLLAQNETLPWAIYADLGEYFNAMGVSQEFLSRWHRSLNIKRNDSPLTLLENISRFRDRQCHDPRDLVYSLISISRDGHLIKVNYDTSLVTLAQSVLSLYEDRLCLCSVTVVAQNLLVGRKLTKSEADQDFIKSISSKRSSIVTWPVVPNDEVGKGQAASGDVAALISSAWMRGDPHCSWRQAASIPKGNRCGDSRLFILPRSYDQRLLRIRPYQGSPRAKGLETYQYSMPEELENHLRLTTSVICELTSSVRSDKLVHDATIPSEAIYPVRPYRTQWRIALNS